MIESVAEEQVVREVEMFRIDVFVFAHFAALQGFEKCRILFVGEIVGGDVVRLEFDGAGEGRFPIGF